MKPLTPLLQALEEHESGLRTFFTARVHCPHTAADLFQQMAEKLLRQAPAAHIENARAYLYRSAQNEIISYFRGQTTREQYENEYADLRTLNDSTADIEQTLIARRKIEKLNQTLQNLPELTQQVFWLYRIEQRKQKEIAEQLNVSLSSVEKHLASALRHCRNALRAMDDYGYDQRQASNQDT
ncbi:MAG: RNA polymerase subunit sigma-24 [Oceanospirillaceae bacterium]|nr:RNA polymerase subunit sigma-24 [Oceanospirillaceae bacterium]MBT13120.1 RNA polymerase subunit sigma-24 [Oceanospirillaceae bacterium]|tara:strand:- start:3785 stop:4333 length:549 start_codon:yes stop_codon:yes gene_type:complete